MANTKRDPKEEAFWRGAVGREAKSGLSVREFCRRNGLSEPSFYALKRTFCERDAENAAAQPVVVREDRPAQSGRDLVIIIEIRSGRLLRLPYAMPAARIVELILALGS